MLPLRHCPTRSLRNTFVVICGSVAPDMVERFNEIIRDVRAIATIESESRAEAQGRGDACGTGVSPPDPLSVSAPQRDSDSPSFLADESRAEAQGRGENELPSDPLCVSAPPRDSDLNSAA